MNPITTIIAASLAAGIGAVCRYKLDSFVASRSNKSIPVGTITVNVFACCLVGLTIPLCASGAMSPITSKIVSTGFLGGFSTFSTATIEGVRLLEEGRNKDAFKHTIGMLVLSLMSCSLGFMLTSM